MATYKRVLIKCSGAAMAGKAGFGLNTDAVNGMAREILAARALGVDIALVIGGGNIFRGNLAEAWGVERVEADNVGMLATVINAMVLKAALDAQLADTQAAVMCAFPVGNMVYPFVRRDALRLMAEGRPVIFAGGIGNPLLTTDYTATQRAIEINADAVLIAKDGVDGVYSADPRKDAHARLYRTLSYEDAIRENLGVMDAAAFLLARDQQLPLHVFNFSQAGAVAGVLAGELIGTTVAPNQDSLFA